MNITTHGGTTDASDKQPGVVTIGSKDGLGHVVWQWTPPPGMNKDIGDDCADEYAIEMRESALGGLILWARWGDKWEPNPWSERYVLRQLLQEMGKWPNR